MATPRWFQQRLRDPFLQKAHRENYRSRAAYKLQEIAEKYKLLKPGSHVLDLGAAPGSWTQVVVQVVGAKGLVVGIDLLEVEPIEGAHLIQGDIRDPKKQEEIRALSKRPFDLILSDMAPNTTGVHHADTANSVELVQLALELANTWLRPGGAFVAKLFEGAEYKELHTFAKSRFGFAKSFKPKASLAASREIYLVCQDFKKNV